MGISDDELRASPHEQIQRRRRERGEAWERLDNRLSTTDLRSGRATADRKPVHPTCTPDLSPSVLVRPQLLI